VADSFVMDWQMLWKEIVIGFLIGGFLAALVPDAWWRNLFVTAAPGPVRLLENVVAGPILAALSFVCSIGNVPVASVLWGGGISFGGVIAFLYGDLLVLPLISAYRKYYDGRRGPDRRRAFQRLRTHSARPATAERRPDGRF
jgi:uncharacterized membrane protein YraQ (UPF0718 family)